MVVLSIALPIHWYVLLSRLYKGLEKGDFMTLLLDRGFRHTQLQAIYQYHIAERNWLQRQVIWFMLSRGYWHKDNWPVSQFPKHTNISTWWFYTSRKFLYRALRQLHVWHVPGVCMEDDDRQQVTTYTWLWWTAYDLYDF